LVNENLVLGLTLVGSFLVIASLGFFLHMRGKAILLFFQQEEYDADRIIAWWWRNRAFDRLTSLALIFIYLMELSLGFHSLEAIMIVAYAAAFAFYAGALRSRAVLASAKKPLVMTDRARRIHLMYLVLAVTAVAGIVLITGSLGSLAGKAMFLLLLQALLFLILAANALLTPIEARVCALFLDEARQKLGQVSPKIIAIAGSYGKTSTKHVLAHILSAVEPTLATPGSVNTEMGITRIVREDLEAKHRYFVVEMGAYGPGAIRRLCRLTPPDLGIITSIGLAHLERFGSEKNVFDAKFELAAAVSENGGRTIINTPRIPADRLRSVQLKEGSLVLLRHEEAVEGRADARITRREVTRAGLQVDIEIAASGSILSLEAPLYGAHQAENIALATLAALELGISEAIIKASLKTLPQVRHRLEVLPSNDGPTVIDDAYNSNPSGFAAALGVLDLFAEPGGRRILITPGMVELGSEHERQHLKLGRLAGKSVDVAFLVTPERVPTFIEGFKETQGSQAVVKTFATQEAAETALKSDARAHDVILFENNLPDLFEQQVNF
jgi:UDP-N-acetylmuramoyl-tripeptide--D-alanyl-D-alanine ligase